MSQPATPELIALSNQVHAEVTDQALRLVRAGIQNADLELTEEKTMLVEIGIQAGWMTTLLALRTRGLLRLPTDRDER